MKILKKYTLYLVWIILGLFSLSQSVFGVTGETLNLQSAPEKPQTIREMQADIKNLEQEKVQLDFKWKTFRIGNENLGELIRQNLTLEEKTVLESLIVEYTNNKENTEKKLNITIDSGEDISIFKKEILLLKQDFYKKLISYIQIERLSNFKTYVASDLAFREKSNEVGAQIEQKSIVRNDRIEEIQGKIQDNKEVLRTQIQDPITQRVLLQLNKFTSQEKFQGLKNESKIYIFESFIEKIEFKKQALQNTLYTTSIIEEKIALYDIIKEIFQSYMQEWR